MVKKRLALTRAYYTNADIYLLDDIDIGIDDYTLKKIVKKIANSSKTFIIVSNNKLLVDIADRVIALKNGTICNNMVIEKKDII